jgi:REP element-mobilizing transposase RayT
MIIDSLLWARDNEWWRILGFVVMPTHYHLTFGLGDKKTLSEAMYSVDRFTASRLNSILGRSGQFWEEGFYDHAIRDRVDFDGILAYIHNNPVSAGLVDAAEDWVYSTANERYQSEIDWEWLGFSVPKLVSDARRFNPDSIAPKYR